MGPLVPEIFNNEFNFVIALILGFFFGYILEQAGFSTSKKLAGLFYGYDFVVLRVFFTAGITAMIGVAAFGYLGWLDLSLIYVNPTFLWSAIVGGLIMGAGFIIGGFCPGTSVAAAAIGKIDAMIFILGSFIGIFLFGEFYQSLKSLYLGSNWGDIRIDEIMGIPSGAFIFMMVVVALAAFFFTARIENRVNGIKPDKSLPFFKQSHNKFLPYAGIFVLAGLVLLVLPDRQTSLKNSLESKAQVTDLAKISMSPLELAQRIINEDPKLEIIDLRSVKANSPKSLPGSKFVKFDDLFSKDVTKLIQSSYKTIVFIDDDGKMASKAVLYANSIGNERAKALRGGLYAFEKTFAPQNVASIATIDISRQAEAEFIREAPRKLDELRTKLANKNKPAETKKKKTAGGC